MENSKIKSFIKQHDEHKQVSLTGARALILMVYLLESPKNFEQIKQFLIDCGVTGKEYSIDTIRIDLNTLKQIGCEISKATKRTNNCYGLLNHPFKLKLSTIEVSTLKNIYKKIAKTASPSKLLRYHQLFIKLSDMMDNDVIKEQLLGISYLKTVDIELLKELVKNEKKFNKIKILYEPATNKEVEYDITIEKLGLRNDKLYLYCYNHNFQKRAFLNISRIKKIVATMFDKNSTLGLDLNIKFKLNNCCDYKLDENETIIEENGQYSIISGKYYNDFIGVQRMMEFGSDCVILEPEHIKQKVINNYIEMSKIYD